MNTPIPNNSTQQPPTVARNPPASVPPLNLQQIQNARLSIPSPSSNLNSASSSTLQVDDSARKPMEEYSKENVQPAVTSTRSLKSPRSYLKEKKPKTFGVRDKMALFDLYAPSMKEMDKKVAGEEMINISKPINTSKFSLKRFPMLRHNPSSEKNVKGGGFTERSPLSPTVRVEQQIYNQQIISTVVDPSAGFDQLPKSVQAPFAKEFNGTLNARLHIPQLPLDTIDMIATDSFGNSLNSVRVNWVKSEEDLTRSVTLTSRSDSVFTRPTGTRVASAGTGRRYTGLRASQKFSKSMPSTSQKKLRGYPYDSPTTIENNEEESYEYENNPSMDKDLDDALTNSETEQLIYESLRTSYYLNVKDEKAKRKGQETITIEEHVKVTNEIIFKITSAFKEKLKKIQLSMRKEIENIVKKYSSEVNSAKEERSDSIVNNFMKDKQIRKQLEKLKEQATDMRKKYDDATDLINQLSVYKERYESMKKEMDKMINGRPSKTAEQSLSRILSNDDKLSNKEKQDLMQDFLKHFFNEDGTLNEKSLFEMFMVNKELHENLSRTRDTVSYLRDQLYEYQKNKANTPLNSPHPNKAQFNFLDNSLIKSQQEKQVLQGLSNTEESTPIPSQVDSQLIYELRNRNDYLRRSYDALSQKLVLADRVAFRIKVLYEGVERYTKCCHCKEPTFKPKVFVCGHAFCSKCCVIDRVKKLDQATNSFRFHCTECREITEELIDNKNLNELLSFANEVEGEVSNLEKNIQEALQMARTEKQKSFKMK